MKKLTMLPGAPQLRHSLNRLESKNKGVEGQQSERNHNWAAYPVKAIYTSSTRY
jgi:hypothetical protein